MTRGRRRVPYRTALLGGLMAASLLACDASEAPPPGPSSAPSAVSTPPRFADVGAYRGDFARTGVNPGPGPGHDPVELWRRDFPGTAIIAQPLLADGRLIAITTEGDVLTLDPATGADVAPSRRLPAGVVSTPATADDVLYAITADGVLRAVSLSDGVERWDQPGYDPNAVPGLADDLVLAGAPDGTLVARRVADGTVAWSTLVPAATRITVAGARVLASGGSSERVAEVDLNSGAVVREHATGGAEALTAAIVGDVAYLPYRDVAGGRNGVQAVGADGSAIWSFEEPERRRIAANVVDDDTVYVLTDTPAVVFALDRGTGELRWTLEVDESSAALPVVADGLYYTAGPDNGLIALDLERSDVAWKAPLETSSEPTRIIVSGGVVFNATTLDGSDGRIVAFAASDDPRRAIAERRTISTGAPGTPGSLASPVAEGPEPGFRLVDVHEVDAGATLMGPALAPDGTLYAPDLANDRILVLAPGGGFRWQGTSGSGKGEFDFAQVTQNDASGGVAVSPDGQLIAVGEGGNHRVQLFDGSWNHLHTIGHLGREDGLFVNPCCVTVDAEHRIWVVDTARADIQVFDENGVFLRRFAGPGNGDGELARPGAAFVRADADEVLVPDFGNRRVAVFDKAGNWLRDYGSRPDEGLFLNEVNGVIVGSDGRMLVIDTSNRIFVLDADGHPLGTVYPTIDGIGNLDTPGIAVDARGHLFATDVPKHLVVELQLEPSLWPVTTADP